MNKNVTVSENFKEVTLTIKFPIDDMLNTLCNMFYHKLNESNREIMNIINESDETLCRLRLCELLNISQTTMTKLIKENRIPYSRVGRKLVFSKREVLEAIKMKGIKK